MVAGGPGAAHCARQAPGSRGPAAGAQITSLNDYGFSGLAEAPESDPCTGSTCTQSCCTSDDAAAWGLLLLQDASGVREWAPAQQPDALSAQQLEAASAAEQTSAGGLHGDPAMHALAAALAREQERCAASDAALDGLSQELLQVAARPIQRKLRPLCMVYAVPCDRSVGAGRAVHEVVCACGRGAGAG